MRTLLDDLRFARRLFSRRRRFALLLVTTIAVGIGAATSIFSIVDSVLWRPLPYPDADRLHWIARTDETWRTSPVLASVWDNLGHAFPDYRHWTESQRSFDATAAWFLTNSVLTTPDGVEQITTGRATASLAPMLGARTAVGRWFTPTEEARDGQRVAVISYETWQSRFGGSRTVLGSRLLLNGQPFEVVGVLPRSFRVAGDTSLVEVWTAAGSTGADWQRNNFNFRVIGRLRADRSPSDASREALQLLGVSDQPGRIGIRLENLQGETVKTVRAPLTILLWAAALLLVIACGNVGTLLVGEMASRDVEISTRVSLGATPIRVMRQILAENLMLAAVGGVLGTGVSVFLVRTLRALAPSGIPRIETAHVDARALLFAAIVAALAAIGFSLAPLATVFRVAPATTLRTGSARLTRQSSRIQRIGIFVQAALVVVLLATATLLVRTHQQLIAVDPGFRAANVLSVRLRFLPPVTRYRDAQSRRVLLEQLATRVTALPGVRRASAAFAVPFQATSTTSIHIEGSPSITDREEVAGTYVIASSGFFETMGIALRAGRLFGTVDDGPGSAVIVSETFARRFWPNANAIGRRIQVDDVWRDVVGVVGDVRHRSVDEPVRATFYLPAAQTAERLLDGIVVESSGDPRDQLAAIRRIVAQEDPTLAIARADRLSDLVAATLVGERFRALLLVVFAATAGLLAAIGIAGVATNATTHRRRELAIRMAVGARPAAAVQLAIGGTLKVALAGAAVGVAAALVASRAIRPFLYRLSPADPASYALVLALISLVALISAWIPAHRVTRLDLARVLGSE